MNAPNTYCDLSCNFVCSRAVNPHHSHELLLAASPPVPVSVLLKGLQAVTDCGDTHLSAVNDRRAGSDGGDEERVSMACKGWHQISPLSFTTLSVSQSVHNGALD